MIIGIAKLNRKAEMANNDHKNSMSPRDGRFATTHWSIVQAAGQPESSRYQQALEMLCEAYWLPIYSYLRRCGHRQDSAEDCTQGFFTRLLEKDGLRLADAKRGKFRSFLLTALKHFLANEGDRNRALKRGGGRHILSLDINEAENRYVAQPADSMTPERVFERSWALAILERTMSRLHDELVAKGKESLLENLKGYLTADKDKAPYQQVASELDMSENAVKVAVHRLRRRYRDLLRDEIAQTVTTEAEIDEEIRDLFAALAH